MQVIETEVSCTRAVRFGPPVVCSVRKLMLYALLLFVWVLSELIKFVGHPPYSKFKIHQRMI